MTWKTIARRTLVPVGILAAFGLGMCVAGGSGSGTADHDHAAEAETVWTCSMHPQVRSSEPGSCPYCGMELIPASQLGGGGSSDDPRRITLSERARILARIDTTPVRPLVGASGERRLLGRVDYDETAVKTVTAWTNGRIDRLHVAATGERLKKGQVIATLYSPEIYAAQSDLIQAARQVARLAGGAEMASRAAASALEAARQRLRLLGLTDAQIQTMEKEASPSQNVTIRTPFGGTVIERLVSEGNYVQAGTGLYRIADLSTLWVQLDAYESDLPHLARGQTVALTVSGLPGQVVEGRVAFIDPVVDPRTRTARVRVEVANAQSGLRPGMYAEARVAGAHNASAEAPLVIPDTAPLFTGRRSIVYVEVPGAERPTYEAREVTLGPRAGGLYPVLSGLELGDRIVTRGAFALDADLQIRGGDSMMTRADDVHRRRSAPVADVPAELKKHLAHIVRSYLALQEGLADDRLEPAKQAAAHLEEALGMARDATPERLRADWAPLDASMSAYARHLRSVASIERARHDFEQLSLDVITLVERFGNPLDEPVRLAYCPMVSGDRGAEWLQRGAELRNAYFGSEMLTCGEVRATVGPNEHLQRAPAPPPAAQPAPEGHGH